MKMMKHLWVLTGVLALGACDIEFENENDTAGPNDDDDVEEIEGTFEATLTSDAVDQDITGTAWFSAGSAATDEDPNGSIVQLYFTDDDQNVYTSDWIYMGRGVLEGDEVMWQEGTEEFASAGPDASTYRLDGPFGVVNIGVDGSTSFHFRSQGGSLEIDDVDDRGGYNAVSGSFTMDLAGCEGLNCEGIGYDLTGTITGTFTAANDDGWISEVPDPLN